MRTLQGGYFHLRAVKIFTARKRKFLYRYTIPETKLLYKTQYISGNFCIHILHHRCLYNEKYHLFCIWPMSSKAMIAKIFAYGQWILRLQVSKNNKTEENCKILTHQNHLRIAEPISGSIKTQEIFMSNFMQKPRF